MKIRVRDKKLPLKELPKKLKPIKLENKVLKFTCILLTISNLFFIFKEYF